MLDSFKARHHSAKFGGHKQCGNKDTIVLVCSMISQDHLIKDSFDFVCENHSKQVIILLSLLSIGNAAVEI